MTPRIFVLFGTLPILAVALASCGGSTFDHDGGTGGSAGDVTGGKGNGGSSEKGGSEADGGFAGTASGGFVTGGTSSAGSGGFGTGGTADLPDLCSLPPESGNCDAYFQSYYHDAATGVCKSFVYGGCGGNENRFDSLEGCLDACGGGPHNLDACTQSSDCTLVAAGCCGACGDSSLSDWVAINYQSVELYSSGMSCELVDCDACIPAEPSGYFAATCHEGQCLAVDLRTTQATACDSPSDCHLRMGSGCCEGCSGDEPISISDPAYLMDLTCGEELVGCPACAPIYPEDIATTCDNGVCGTKSEG